MTTLSPQQNAVVDFVASGQGSAFVEAVAGAGKTTTLIHALAATNGSVAFTAYNKKIADEIKVKVAKLNLGNRVRVGTFHSFGFGAWRQVYPKVKVDDREKAQRTRVELNIPKELETFVSKLVSLAKQRALGLFGQIDDESQWYSIIEHFDLAYEIEDPQQVAEGVALAIRALRFHIQIAPELIDFDDMIYMPVTSGCRMWENDFVFVDEAQDTNPARRALARKMLKRNGRAIFVGDRHQAIYGFTGADSDAIDQITRDFRCSTLPLTVTFRCPKAVVAMAHEVVTHIEAHETAPEGSVRTITDVELPKSGLTEKDAVLCRKTKPLVDLAYTLIRNGTACHVEGRDIGVGLIKLVNRFSVRSLEQLRTKLQAYSERECEKLVAKGRETQAEALADRVETVLVIADNGCQTVDDLRVRITSLFMDSDNERKPTLTLSTVHKSKGREWQRVFVLGRNAWMPSPWARQEWQMQQERNLIYVAYTRAMSELVLVDVTVEK